MRRVMNWLPLGLPTPSFYMGRYNLKVSKFRFEEMQDATGGAMMGNDDFSTIFTVGVWVYGSSFIEWPTHRSVRWKTGHPGGSRWLSVCKPPYGIVLLGVARKQSWSTQRFVCR